MGLPAPTSFSVGECKTSYWANSYYCSPCREGKEHCHPLSPVSTDPQGLHHEEKFNWCTHSAHEIPIFHICKISTIASFCFKSTLLSKYSKSILLVQPAITLKPKIALWQCKHPLICTSCPETCCAGVWWRQAAGRQLPGHSLPTSSSIAGHTPFPILFQNRKFYNQANIAVYFAL